MHRLSQRRRSTQCLQLCQLIGLCLNLAASTSTPMMIISHANASQLQNANFEQSASASVGANAFTAIAPLGWTCLYPLVSTSSEPLQVAVATYATCGEYWTRGNGAIIPTDVRTGVSPIPYVSGPPYQAYSEVFTTGDADIAIQVTGGTGLTNAVGQNVTQLTPGIQYSARASVGLRIGFAAQIASILMDTTVIASMSQPGAVWSTLQSSATQYFTASKSVHRMALQGKSIDTGDGMSFFDSIQLLGDVQSSSFEYPLLPAASSTQVNYAFGQLPFEWARLSTSGSATSNSIASGGTSTLGSVGTVIQCSPTSLPCAYALNSTLPLQTNASDGSQYVYMTAYRGQTVPTVLGQKLEMVAVSPGRQYVFSLYVAQRCDSASMCASAALQVKVQLVGRPATSQTILSMYSSNDCLPINPRQWQRLVTQPFTPSFGNFQLSIEVLMSPAAASSDTEATLLIDSVQLQPYNSTQVVTGQSLSAQCLTASLASLPTDERSFELPRLTPASIAPVTGNGSSISPFITLSASTPTHHTDGQVPQGWTTSNAQSISLVQSCIPSINLSSSGALNRSCSYTHTAQSTGSLAQSTVGAVMSAADQQQYVAIRLLSTSVNPSTPQIVTLTRRESVTASMLNRTYAVSLQVAQRCDSLTLCEPLSFVVSARYSVNSIARNINSIRTFSVPLYNESDTSAPFMAAGQIAATSRPRLFGQWRRIVTQSFQLQNVSQLTSQLSSGSSLSVAIEIRVQRRTGAATNVEASLLVDDLQFYPIAQPFAVYPSVCCSSSNVCTPNNLTRSGVSLWLRPDSIQTSGSTVTSWRDVSAMNAHATTYGVAPSVIANCSVFNGLRCVNFNSSLQQSMYQNGIIISRSQSSHTFIVSQLYAASDYAGIFSLSDSGATTDEAGPVDSQLLLQGLASAGGADRSITWPKAGGSYQTSVLPQSNLQPNVLEMEVRGDLSSKFPYSVERRILLRQNSTTSPALTASAYMAAPLSYVQAVAYNAFTIMSRPTYPSSGTSSALLAELIYVNQSLTSQERFAINQYLALKFNLPQLVANQTSVNSTYDEQIAQSCTLPVQPRVCMVNGRSHIARYDTLSRSTVVLSLRADRGVVMSMIGNSSVNSTSVSVWRDNSPLGNDLYRVSSDLTPALPFSGSVSNSSALAVPIQLIGSDSVAADGTSSVYTAAAGAGSYASSTSTASFAMSSSPLPAPFIRLSVGTAFASLQSFPVLKSRSIWLVTRRAIIGSGGLDVGILSVIPPLGISSDQNGTSFNPSQMVFAYLHGFDNIVSTAQLQDTTPSVVMPIRSGEFNLIHYDFEQDASTTSIQGWVTHTINGVRQTSQFVQSPSKTYDSSSSTPNRGVLVGGRWLNSQVQLTPEVVLDVAEILVLSQSMNTDDMNRIGWELASRYQLSTGYTSPSADANCTDMTSVPTLAQSTSLSQSVVDRTDCSNWPFGIYATVGCKPTTRMPPGQECDCCCANGQCICQAVINVDPITLYQS